MTEPDTGKSPSKLGDTLGWTDCCAIDAAALRTSVRQRFGWTARCTNRYQVERGR